MTEEKRELSTVILTIRKTKKSGVIAEYLILYKKENIKGDGVLWEETTVEIYTGNCKNSWNAVKNWKGG